MRVTRTYTHTHADPRDSFAQRPARGHDGKFTGNLEGGREASAAVRASMAREALHVLPNMERRRKAAAAAGGGGGAGAARHARSTRSERS